MGSADLAPGAGAAGAGGVAAAGAGAGRMVAGGAGSAAGGLGSGKLPPAKLRQLVLSHLGARRPEVLIRARVGEDSAVFDPEGDLVAVSSDPITGATAGMGRMGVHVACNDLAACGAIPFGLQVVLLLPEGVEEEAIAGLMEEIDGAASAIGVEVMGGHTEITPRVNAPVLILTAIGRVARGRAVSSAGGRPGDSLVITKGAGIEGTAILAWDLADQLRPALGDELVRRAQAFRDAISVIPEGLEAARLGAHALHDVTEGGLYGAVAEVAEASGCGAELWEEAVPVRPETEALCRHLGLDPLGLISSGTLLIATDRPEAMVEGLGAIGLTAAVVGKLTPPQGGLMVRRRGGGLEPIPDPPVDELWRFYDRQRERG